MKIENRKARFDYHILETYECGIVLTGTEIKSIRNGNVSLVDTFCTISGNIVSLHNSYIKKYINGSYNNHEENRIRKLLLTKQEINKLYKRVQQKGYTLIPLSLYINKSGLCKVSLGLCVGKKEYDKRETIKERDISREINCLSY